jgi:hypothetical protein
LECVGKLQCEHFEPLDLDEEHAEGKPQCEFHTRAIQAAVSGETLSEGLYMIKLSLFICHFFIRLFH